mmetsp:Transcript_27692/g.54329  ORF Transcript_27692/g.54329 Transcript_27692/m.54329 type:complete len:80 (+) Transcript_27692:2242-2481(+)
MRCKVTVASLSLFLAHVTLDSDLSTNQSKRMRRDSQEKKSSLPVRFPLFLFPCLRLLVANRKRLCSHGARGNTRRKKEK